MRVVSRKIVCGLLSLLLVLSGQAAAMSAQAMLPGEDTSTAAGVANDCGRLANDHSAGEPDMSSGCSGETYSMACLMSAGHCAMTLVLASVSAFTFSETYSHEIMPGPLSAYQSPLLDVITPPPDFFSS